MGYRVLASITAGEKPGLYASTDLNHWQLIAAGANYRLSESYDRQSVLGANEEVSDSSLLLESEGQTNFTTPACTLRAGGDFSSPATTIACANTRVGVVSLSVDAWDAAPVCASLAASPDFPKSGIVIVGGFRTGIFWSGDAGKTWQRVMVNPSTLVKGSNEIYEVQFLSPKNVIVINGCFAAWIYSSD